MTDATRDMPTTEALEALLAEVTLGRRVRFHPDCCPEAKGTPCEEWDSSHDTSVITPNGTRYRGYAVHKHANDAALDDMAIVLAREVIALRAELARVTAERDQLRATLSASQAGEDRVAQSLEQAKADFYELANQINDEDYEGPLEGFTVPVVCHAKPYHVQHVDNANGSAKCCEAALAAYAKHKEARG